MAFATTSDRPRALLLVLALLLVGLAGCAGPGRFQYDGGRCFKDGHTLSATEVEDAQADVARRIASRQPWFAVITIGVVLIAAAGNAEKALMLVRARQAQGPRPMAERLRDVLARQSERPALLRTFVVGSLAAIMLAGGAYIYLDIDKRASERALAMLQFCHLALRTQEEQSALDEQRRNLQAIESTAGDIRTLVDKLPPDQQRKAQLIVTQMNSALDRQGRVVGEYIERTDEAQKDLSTHTQAMEKGLASVEGELSELRGLPADLKDLQGAARHINETTASFDGRFAELRAQIDGVGARLDTLIARPACPPPAPPAPPKVAVEAPASSTAAEVASGTPKPAESAHALAPVARDGGKAAL
jgi:hypothetical protein